MKTSESIKTMTLDLIKALGELEPVKKDLKNPFLKNKYASYDAIRESARLVLLKNNLCQLAVVNNDGVETFLVHSSGEWISSGVLTIPVEVSKGLSQAQAEGVTITYAKRYQLGALLGLSSDEDTDGQIGDNKDLKEVKPEPKPEHIGPIQMTDKVFEKYIVRMNGGEKGLPEKIRKSFILNSTQDRTLGMFEKPEEKIIENINPVEPNLL